MSGQLQPKQLSELAFTSLTTYLEDKGRELMTSARMIGNDFPSTETLAEDKRTFRKLKLFFHGFEYSPPIANELTKHLLVQLNKTYTVHNVNKYDNYYEKIIGEQLVEVYMHLDATEISLGRRHSQAHSEQSIDEIGTIMLRKMGNLSKLKKLNLRWPRWSSKETGLCLPNQIKELLCDCFSFTNEHLTRIVESCPELKTLKLSYFDNFERCIATILQLKHLETLHLISGFDLDEDYAALMNVTSTDTTTSIRSIGLPLNDENTLHQVIEKWPSLTEIILEREGVVDLSSLAQLRNLRSLTLREYNGEEEYRNVLPALGENLISLYLGAYPYLDLEFIGQTCTQLKTLCLHCFEMEITEPSLEIFPNFKTIESLKVNMRRDPVWTEFIIDQCTDVKELYVALNSSLYGIIVKVIERTPLDSVQEIHWWANDDVTDTNSIQDIRSKYPNLPLRVEFPCYPPECAVFYFNGCRHLFGEEFSP